MRLLAPAAAAAALLALAGCSDPEPGSPLPTGAPAETSTTTAPSAPSTTTTPTEDATAAQPGPGPTLPPEATTDDAAGAEAFVRYWYDVANYSVISGDVDTLQEVSDVDCQTCNRLIEVLEEQYSTGGRFQGGQSVVAEVTAPAPSPDGYVVAAFVLTQEPPIAVSAEGDVQNPDEAERDEVYLQMSMRWEEASWRAVEIAA